MPKRKSTPQYKFRPGQIVAREIQRYQTCTTLIMPRLMFHRVVREIGVEIRQEFKITQSAVEALQWAAEDYLTQVFSVSQQQACRDNRLTILPIDFMFATSIEQQTRYQRRVAFKAARKQAELDYQSVLIRNMFASKIGWHLADRIGSLWHT